MELPIDPDKCDHFLVLTRRSYRNKSIHYQRQCTVCWQAVGSTIPKAEAMKEGPLESFPAFDDAARQRSWDRLRQFRSHQTVFELVQFRPAYDEYLKSPSWLDKRRLVLQRANDMCEGCGVAKATQVHHFHYGNFGNEFLWELVAVCQECHDRAHPWKLDDPNPVTQMQQERLRRELAESRIFQEWLSKREQKVHSGD